MDNLDLDAPITQHMHRHITRLLVNQTVADALTSLRTQPPTGRIIYFYVVDPSEKLVGVVPTRRLLLATEDTPIESLMIRHLVTVPENATVLEVCELFIQYRFLALPVVNAEQKLVGVADVELYTSEIGQLDEKLRLDDLFQLMGVNLAGLRTASPLKAVASRFPWLLCNIGGGLLAAFLTGFFEAELQKAVALALFIPVVLALAESVSIQSVSLTLERLHSGPATWQRLVDQFRREMFTGVGLGALCGVLVAGVALLWLWQPLVALCVLGGITAGVTIAALVGLATPGVLRMLTREPRVAAGPLALALSDLATLLVYFGLARWLLG